MAPHRYLLTISVKSVSVRQFSQQGTAQLQNVSTVKPKVSLYVAQPY